ncbi:MAG: photosynthetic complex putative assembly protein PuhB [Oceanicaulis sp.]
MTRVPANEAREALPGPLPEGERVLWAARPPFGAILRHMFKGRWLAGAAGVLAIWPVLAALDAGYPFARALTAIVLFAPLALPVGVLLWIAARLMARHTLYVATDRRVILHVGYVFTRTVNLPLSQVRDLSVRPLKGGFGDLQLTIDRAAPVGYAALFPHVRLGRLFTPTPVLRCVPEADGAADALAEALMRVRPGFRSGEDERAARADGEAAA